MKGAGREHVLDRHQDRVLDGHRRLLRPAPRPSAVVLRPVVAPLRPRRCPRHLRQRVPQPSVSPSDGLGLALSGALVVARANPGAGREVRGSRKLRHVIAGLCQDRLGRSPSDPRNALQKVKGRPESAEGLRDDPRPDPLDLACSTRRSDPDAGAVVVLHQPGPCLGELPALARRLPLARPARAFGSSSPAIMVSRIALPVTQFHSQALLRCTQRHAVLVHKSTDRS